MSKPSEAGTWFKAAAAAAAAAGAQTTEKRAAVQRKRKQAMAHLQQLRRQPRTGKVCRKLGREDKAAAGNNTPIEYKDTLIRGKSQLLMTLQIFLSTNDGTAFIFVTQKGNDIKNQA